MRTPSQWQRLARTPAAELKRIQDDTLARYVREELYPFSTHYRRVFDAAGVAPADIRGVDDLRRLPFTTKQDLLAVQSNPETRLDFVLRPNSSSIRAHWPLLRKLALLIGGARSRELLRFHYTPNFMTFTTGRSSEPVAFAYTPHDLDVLGEAIARLIEIGGIDRVDDRIVNMMPFAPHLAFWAVTLGGFKTGRLVLPTGGGKVMGTEGNLRLAERIKATALVGTPGFMYHMLRRAREERRDLAQVRTVILGAEKVPLGLKQKMAEALAVCGAEPVTILGTYGFTEARMAFSECPTALDESSGYHLLPDLGVFEVIDPESGEPVGEGQDGELVYTGTSGHGTTVCRYRTGDLVVGGLVWEPCPWCHRTLPRISSELRRVSERHALNLTKIKGTLVDMSHMGTVLSQLPEIEEWQVVLSKKHDDPLELDQLEVRYAPRSGTDTEQVEHAIRSELTRATEVSPNRVTAHTLEEMLSFLGMETEMKEKRYLDRRPQS
jgi:phenylacetate-coenzyme A ligase PaaK-like adenylate-forming protein